MEVNGVPVLATVEDIIRELKIELQTNDIELLKDIKPTHNNVMVTCISHADGQERHPSLGISTVQVDLPGRTIPEGTCNCFTCGYTADLPTFISNALGYNDGGIQGFKWITQKFVNLAVEERKPIELNMTRELEDEDIDFDESPITNLDEFRYTHPYMYRRKLTDKVIEYFDIGYDKDTHSITFPVFDENGHLALIQRRSVEGKKFLNDEGGNKGNHVYGLYQVYKNLSWIKELYITESPIDALTLWTKRIPAVALMGARITETQAKLLLKLPIRKFISALDNDNAGESGTEKLKKQLGSNKIIYRLSFPQGVKDVNMMSETQLDSIKYNLI